MANKATRLDAALTALNQAIREGQEFPDACYRIAAKFLVLSEALKQAYDEQER